MMVVYSLHKLTVYSSTGLHFYWLLHFFISIQQKMGKMQNRIDLTIRWLALEVKKSVNARDGAEVQLLVNSGHKRNVRTFVLHVSVCGT